MKEARGTVQGRHNSHRTAFYGISTCVWCKRTRKFLEDQKVEFEFTYVDLVQGSEREAVLKEVRRWNPATSFPTIVVDDSKSVIGYRPEEIKEVLGL
jgi:glutaredoxin-like protein NrdH